MVKKGGFAINRERLTAPTENLTRKDLNKKENEFSHISRSFKVGFQKWYSAETKELHK